jgi:hypothetical protein
MVYVVQVVHAARDPLAAPDGDKHLYSVLTFYLPEIF